MAYTQQVYFSQFWMFEKSRVKWIIEKHCLTVSSQLGGAKLALWIFFHKNINPHTESSTPQNWSPCKTSHPWRIGFNICIWRGTNTHTERVGFLSVTVIKHSEQQQQILGEKRVCEAQNSMLQYMMAGKTEQQELKTDSHSPSTAKSKHHATCFLAQLLATFLYS